MGIDIGTSSVRAVLFDEQGHTQKASSVEYSLLGANGVAELRPDEILDGLIKCVEDIAGASDGTAPAEAASGLSARVGESAIGLSAPNDSTFIAAAGISCQMHSLMCVDADGAPLTNLITWADTRATKQADEILASGRVDELYKITGCRVQHPMYPLAKLIWLRENEPAIFSKAAKFITIKEYILHKFFGEYVVDYTLAASQGYFDINKNEWSEVVLRDFAGIGVEKLSRAVECTHVLKSMKPEFADFDIPFVIGSGDGIMANLGCGVADDTALSVTVGTSGAVRTSVKAPLLDKEQRTWCYSFTNDTWVAGGATNSGGIALKYLRDRLGAQLLEDAGRMCADEAESAHCLDAGRMCADEAESAHRSGITRFAPGQEYEAMDYLASQVPAGCDGLVFLPYLMGERSPDWNPKVRGMMAGLELSHGNGHICRAAMEGVIFRLYSVYKSMAAINSNATQIRATGGIVKSEFWMQILADVFGKEILVAKTQEGAALGAAFTAMVAVKAVAGFSDLLEAMHPVKSITPRAEAHFVYAQAYERAMELYESNNKWMKTQEES